ncbi:hypothetical protein V474_25455 [Novosphingobium barchaimii LL02]|uniref:Uncharacterized protein n=1 Tax=Novosphingobium barchaimii LL02 TaxID=1114963 RepID=A0A0J7XLM6_9SPHN|nr:hypothetical protein [Novosphingobium barchaimii]KMS52891.1 hypothetical protein V474_25455 [Novosphingobium barchaimii LL02]
MDTVHGQFPGQDEPDAGSAIAENTDSGARAPIVANDERRMQVRAYNFWAGLLGTRTFPDIADLKPESLPDFGPRSVLLDFTASSDFENPAIAYLGALLADECGADGPIRTLAQVPSRSLLSRITDHYMQIIANEAPIGFEAEFVNHADVTILYRGILLPFSQGGSKIDFIYGVINWKERAAQLDVDPPVRAQPRDPRPAMLRGFEPLPEWADGPAELDPIEIRYPAIEDYSPMELPRPGFAMEDEPSAFAEQDMGLADWLASARELALLARGSEERSHRALYDAIGRAYDFALAAIDAPEEFAGLVGDAGLKAQERAPLIPLVKLVFGADYDKTRLTEFAAVIAHGRRIGLGRGTFADHLGAVPGGLKALVREERRLRREEDGDSKPPANARERLVKGLRALKAQPLDAIARQGEEFTVLVARRLESGEVVLVGEVSGDEALLQRAARHLLG